LIDRTEFKRQAHQALEDDPVSPHSQQYLGSALAIHRYPIPSSLKDRVPAIYDMCSDGQARSLVVLCLYGFENRPMFKLNYLKPPMRFC